MSSDTDRRRELEESIAEASGFLSTHEADGGDFALAERVAVAHYKRARALKLLDRHRESLEDWDCFLSRWTLLHPHPNGSRRSRLVVALAFKSESLWFVGRRGESTLLEQEIAERYGADLDPTIRWFVTMALVRRAQKLVREPSGLEAAVAASDELIQRYDAVPDDRLFGATQLMLTHARHLLALRSVAVGDVIAHAVEVAINTGMESTGQLVARIDARVDLPWLHEIGILAARLTPATLRRHRRQETQALKVLSALTARIEEVRDSDLTSLAIQARFLTAAVNVYVGHPVEGCRAISDIWGGHDAPTVQALTDLADVEATRPGLLGQINTVALLSRRAISLIGEDPALARLAFDDSVTARLGDDLSPVVRFAVRMMRPEIPRKRG